MFLNFLARMKKSKDEGSGEEMNKEPAQSYGATDLPLQSVSTNQQPSALPVEPPKLDVPKPGIINTFFKVDSEKSLLDIPSAVDNNSESKTQSLLQPCTLEPPGSEKSLQVSQISLCPSTVNDNRLLLQDTSDESTCRIIGEVVFPFTLAGVGCVFAGVILDIVKNWEVFREVSEIFILVPALLGLKGNLEMTLASRLSTQANLGNMDTRQEQWKMVYGNLALTQVQATVVGLLASLFAIMLGWVPEGKFNLLHGLLMAASSVLTASLATLILGSLMIGVVMVSRRLRINPDNVATPIAASLGDLTTISLLAFICQNLYVILYTHKWVSPTILAVILALVPLWWYISHHNKYTNNVLYTGWVPVIGAMFISSMGGLVLDYAVNKFNGLAVFQPVINGVGGNLVAVQASRLSTALHTVSTPGTLPENAVRGCPNPISTFFGTANSARTSRVLMLMVVPGHLMFMLIIFLMHQTVDFKFTVTFIVLYLLAAVIQVAVLLYIANAMVHSLWARGNDPDNSSIPYLTAIGDLLGTSLLAITFVILANVPK